MVHKPVRLGFNLSNISIIESRQVQTCILNLNCPSPVDKWKLARTCLIIDAGLPEDGIKKSRSYLLLMRAPHIIPAEDESDIQSEEEEELRELEAGEEITDTDANQSEQSQLSYRPMSPKAPPLPPGLGLMREQLMTGEQETRQAEKGSKESVAKSQGSTKPERVSSRGGNVSRKDQTSQKSRQASPTQAATPQNGKTSPEDKNGTSVKAKSSRPPTQGSATSKRSRTSVRSRTELDDENENASRPRSMHEDPVTQMEIEQDGSNEAATDDEQKGETQEIKKEEPSSVGDEKEATEVKPKTPVQGPDPEIDVPSRPPSNISNGSKGQRSQGGQSQRSVRSQRSLKEQKDDVPASPKNTVSESPKPKVED